MRGGTGLIVEQMLGAASRGEIVPWVLGNQQDASRLFVERGRYHGVLALIHEQLQAPGRENLDWPKEIVQICRDAAVGQAMWELRHRTLLSQVFTALADVQVQPIVFKGTALAYDLYPLPSLRTRGDTDLLVPVAARATVNRVLCELGYTPAHAVQGELISYQGNYEMSDAATGIHALDVHWRINNGEVLSRLFTYEELLARSAPVLGLGPHARRVDRVDALLIACMHRARHKVSPYYVDGVAYFEADRLIWLLDIAWLARSLSVAEFEVFVDRAGRKGLAAVCKDGLEMAQRSIGVETWPELWAALVPPREEVPWRYLVSGPLVQKWMDMQALGTWRRRAAYVREALFPSSGYMHEKFQSSGGTPLMWLYARRAAAGIVRQLRRPKG